MLKNNKVESKDFVVFARLEGGNTIIKRDNKFGIMNNGGIILPVNYENIYHVAKNVFVVETKWNFKIFVAGDNRTPIGPYISKREAMRAAERYLANRRIWL